MVGHHVLSVGVQQQSFLPVGRPWEMRPVEAQHDCKDVQCRAASEGVSVFRARLGILVTYQGLFEHCEQPEVPLEARLKREWHQLFVIPSSNKVVSQNAVPTTLFAYCYTNRIFTF